MTYLCIGYYVLIITALTLTECRKKIQKRKVIIYKDTLI